MRQLLGVQILTWLPADIQTRIAVELFLMMLRERKQEFLDSVPFYPSSVFSRQCRVLQGLGFKDKQLFLMMLRERKEEFLDSVPFYPSSVFSRQCRVLQGLGFKDKQRISSMNRRQYVREIASSNFVEALDKLFGDYWGLPP